MTGYSSAIPRDRATFTGVEIGMQAGLCSLLPQIVDAVRVPVIAAGGIADARTAAAAFMLGASAVQRDCLYAMRGSQHV